MTLTFEPRSHAYRWAGRRITSVTQVLKWAGYYAGYQFAKQDDLNRARTLGIRVHDAIDAASRTRTTYSSGGDRTGKSSVAMCMEQFNLAVMVLELEIVETELRLVSAERDCAGTLDILGRQWGEWVMVDVKVMKKVNKSALQLQTAKYVEMVEDHFDLGEPVARRFGIQLQPGYFTKHELTDPLAAVRFNRHLRDYHNRDQAGETK